MSDRATHFEGLPHLSCKRDQIKMRDYMDRRVTPSKWVTMPTRGPPPPCKGQKIALVRDLSEISRGEGGGNFKFGFGI